MDLLEYKSFSNEKDLQQLKLKNNDTSSLNDGHIENIKNLNQT
jgi:hypothetical protein